MLLVATTWQRPCVRPTLRRRCCLSRIRCNASTWSSTLSTLPTLPEALDDAIARLAPNHPQPAHLALVFASSLYGPEQLQQLVPHLTSRLPSLEHVFGSTVRGLSSVTESYDPIRSKDVGWMDVIDALITKLQGYGVVGTPSMQVTPCEIEQQPAISLTLAHLPCTTLTTSHVTTLPDADAPPSAWHDLLNTSPSDHCNLLVLADPTYVALTNLLAGLDYAFPGATVLGGLSSADLYDFNRRALLCWSRDAPVASTTLAQHGAAVLSMQGGIDVRPIVSQGCRPLGEAIYTIEQVLDNVVLLASATTKQQQQPPRPPLELLRRALDTLPSQDRAAAARSLLAGILPTSGNEPLVRPIIGVVPATGGIALSSDAAVVGRRFQFVVRDAASSREQLAQRMADVKRAQLQALVDDAPTVDPPLGCLMFSCNGRGSALYGRPHVDARLVGEFVGGAPLAGLQCAGEVGPVGGQSQLLGFSCAVGLVHVV